MDGVANGSNVETFEQLGNALAVSTSLEEFSFSVLRLIFRKIYA